MKKGFTLIELLAVIVILAIIALIATPIVLNIINETKESASLRSAEMYLDAAEYAIADIIINKGGLESENYYITEEGDICKEEVTKNSECTSGVIEVEVSGEKPSSGSITITGGSISDVEINLNSNDKTIVKNEKGELVYQASICTYVNNGVAEKTAGAKYTCKVDPNKDSYTFYVLSYTDKDGNITDDLTKAVSTNLIMDKNICSDGTEATSSNTCLVEYNADGDAADVGPVEAMNYLNDATSTWSNIENLNITYNDEGENFTNFQITGKSRMPYLSEVNDYDGTNGYLYENLSSEGWRYEEGQPTNNIENIYGYWTLSSDDEYSGCAWYVDSYGIVSSEYVDGIANTEEFSGVRPVINLKL